MTIDLIKKAKVIFWDFDGVIKDSVSVKSDAFEELFYHFGNKLAKKVRNHHEKNGGISRYDKLPIYLSWAGKELSKELIDEYEKRFSKLVKKEVINSQWVEGVLKYLQKNYNRQLFFLVTATPQNEIEEITKQLHIDKYFKKIIGSPFKKKDALQTLLIKYHIDNQQALMIGDSHSDYHAAKKNQVEFIIRKTKLNKELQQILKCKMIENFNYG